MTEQEVRKFAVNHIEEYYGDGLLNQETMINLFVDGYSLGMREINLTIPIVSNWVAIKDLLPDNETQVFVKYENGKYGINEWWENDNCWKYQFDNMIVKEWCKPPCC